MRPILRTARSLLTCVRQLAARISRAVALTPLLLPALLALARVSLTRSTYDA